MQQLKYHQLYYQRTEKMLANAYNWIEIDGESRPLTRTEIQGRMEVSGERFATASMISQSGGSNMQFPVVINGATYHPSRNTYWKTNEEGMNMLKAAGRLFPVKNTLTYKRYANDFNVVRITNWWDDTIQSTFAVDKKYVVETNPRVIARCMLMTTDPGDLVFDPTCGSGATAFVAEQWGRRWITCDTSRVAVALAKQRLMTALYDYYELAHPDEGVGSGFVYKTVPHITLRSIANNPDIREGMTRGEVDAAIARHAPQETLYDQPKIDASRRRVSGPFTVEAVPAVSALSVDELADMADFPPDPESEDDAPAESVAVAPRSGEANRQEEWRGELAKTGIRGKAGQHLRFARLEPLPGFRRLHADGQTLPDANGDGAASQRAVVSFGPDHAPLERRQVQDAVQEAQTLVPRPEIVLFAAFQFDPEAAKDIDETRWPGVALLKAQMNADLLTEDLKRKRASNESFWLVGQPDVEVETIAEGADAGKLRARIHGFDYYDTQSGNLYPGGKADIAMWLLDPDYDGRSLYPRQAFFPMAGATDGWARLARNLRAEIDESLIEAYRGTESLPFEAGEHRRAAVKIVDARGVESLRVLDLG